MRPVVAFLTDFGLQDHYVGAMKGVVLGIAREAAIVDITHDVPPQDVLAGAMALAASVAYLPTATVVIAVVDPGVGTSRRGLAAEAGGYRFVGPDNGVLSLALGRFADARVVALANGQYARPTVSRTFQGRDRFAPAGAWLALGVALDALGPAVDDWVRVEVPRVSRDGDTLVGQVVRVDRFGNLITNVAASTIGETGTVAMQGIDVPRVGTYAAAPRGTLCAVVGSSGHLEIAVSGGNAAAHLGVGPGAIVRVLPAPPVRP